jgi:hypothetical protein
MQEDSKEFIMHQNAPMLHCHSLIAPTKCACRVTLAALLCAGYFALSMPVNAQSSAATSTAESASAGPATSSAGRTVEGVKLAESVMLDGQPLKLNGTGVRAVAWLKGYVTGLYVTKPSRDAAQLISAKGAKRISMHMLREADSEVFVKALYSGFRKNHSEAQMKAFGPRMDVFDDAIKALGAVKAGDVVNLDFLPGRGLVMTFNGQVRGKPVPGDDFYAAVMKIFIGERPVDKKMKAGLLGA